jgi:ArsR family transcriptional regulator, arsenate/arsenite/antimonite-responsive transcriptional repressor
MKTTEDEIVKIAKALSDKTRLRILGEISKRKSMTCGETEKIAGLAQSTVSHHIKILCEAGLLDMEKDGRHVIISVNRKMLNKFTAMIGHSICT